MSRILRILGAGVLAVLALGAVMAAGAQAKFDTFRTFPTESSVILTGEADTAVVFTTAGGASVTCTGIKSNPGVTVKDKATEETGHPEFSGCKIGGLVNTAVTTTGCNFRLTSETDERGDAAVQVECEAGRVIKIGPTLGCEFGIGEQTVRGLHGNNVETGVGTTEMHITGEATVTGISYTTKGCASLTGEANGEHVGAEYTGTTTIKGFKDVEGVEGGQAGITLETLATAEMP